MRRICMAEIDDSMNEKKVLLMLSGGRDSFLSACRLIGNGYQVHTVTYDNGYMSQTDAVNGLVERLQSCFGELWIRPAGIHPIAQNIQRFLVTILYKEPVELCREYPHLLISQVNCLACHTVMYLHSIAYCKANNISAISEGARQQQKFFVELPEMRERYEKLCDKYNIELILPVYDLESYEERKRELAEWGFLPKSFEPQCWMGCPILQDLTDEQRSDLTKYYDNEIFPFVDEIIENNIRIKKAKQFDKNGFNNYV